MNRVYVHTAHAAHHAVQAHVQSTYAAIRATQMQQRQSALLAIPSLRAAAALAGAEDLIEGLEDSLNPGDTLIVRLRAVPARDRRRISEALGGLAVAVSVYVDRTRSYAPMLSVVLALYVLRNAVDASLGDDRDDVT